MDSAGQSAPKKVLIVEDDFFILDLYKRVFTKAGYLVESAVDGEEGFTKAQQPYDIILLDIMLPKMTGIEVLKKLRAPGTSTVHTPVFLITNLGQETIIKEAFRIGADGYILKAQLTPQEVVVEVSNFFARKQSEKDPAK